MKNLKLHILAILFMLPFLGSDLYTKYLAHQHVAEDNGQRVISDYVYLGARAILVSHLAVKYFAAQLKNLMFDELKVNPLIRSSEALRRFVVKLAAND